MISTIFSSSQNKIHEMMAHLKKVWEIEQYKVGCGTYICIYHVGKWDELPSVYEKILKFADRNKLHLIGNAYEIGLNEIAVKNKKDYITRILIQVE